MIKNDLFFILGQHYVCMVFLRINAVESLRISD